MLKRIVDITLAYRWFVVLGILVLLAVGGYALYTLPVEAFPDLTNNQVTVVTEAPSMPPTEVEQLVTYPIEQSMMGMPKQQEVRSLSELGLSMITIVFDDSVSMYFARQMVNERLQQITSQLPDGIQPVLGLPATAFGNVIVALIARFWLHEAISLERWAGIALITLGVSFVAQGPPLTVQPPDPLLEPPSLAAADRSDDARLHASEPAIPGASRVDAPRGEGRP